MTKNASILGAGLVGSLLSIYLAKRGYKTSIYERRSDMRKSNISVGRSINLALSDRGWKALDGIGIGDKIRKIGIPMYGRMIHNLNGSLSFLPYGKKDQAIYSVSRGGLNCKLMDLAEEHKNVSVYFNERCTGIDLTSNHVKLENTETLVPSSISSDLIFGADGAFSAARLQLQLSTDKFNYSQYYIEHGYKELTIPADENGKWKMEKNALHIWPRGSFMLIALPNQDGSFTCTLFFPFEGEKSFSSLKTEKEVKEFFMKVFPDAVPIMPDLLEDYFHNPVSSLVTVRCFPWIHQSRLALIGDAAHAIVPFFGQGMNCGFEDCTVLNQLMNKHGENWEAIFSEFEETRKPDADAIADLALQNFIEMRDLVTDPDFLLRKKIEAKFSEQYPQRWTPLYSMVTFSNMRYSEALKEGRHQDKIMEKVLALPEIEKKWDSKEVEDFILKLI